IKASEFENRSIYQKEKMLHGVKSEGLEFPERNLPIDPYYLGLYLGDGCKYDFSILVNKTKDCEILEEIIGLGRREFRKVCLRSRNKYRNDYNYEMVDVYLGVHSLHKLERNRSYKQQFQKLNLKSKHIPDSYFTSSRSQRLELLAGILDTDGYYAENQNRFELTIVDQRLAKDIIRLSRDLGFIVSFFTTVSNGNK